MQVIYANAVRVISNDEDVNFTFQYFHENTGEDVGHIVMTRPAARRLAEVLQRILLNDAKVPHALNVNYPDVTPISKYKDKPQ